MLSPHWCPEAGTLWRQGQRLRRGLAGGGSSGEPVSRWFSHILYDIILTGTRSPQGLKEKEFKGCRKPGFVEKQGPAELSLGSTGFQGPARRAPRPTAGACGPPAGQVRCHQDGSPGQTWQASEHGSSRELLGSPTPLPTHRLRRPSRGLMWSHRLQETGAPAGVCLPRLPAVLNFGRLLACGGSRQKSVFS